MHPRKWLKCKIAMGFFGILASLWLGAFLYNFIPEKSWYAFPAITTVVLMGLASLITIFVAGDQITEYNEKHKNDHMI